MRIHLDKAAMFGAVIVLWQFLNNSTSLPDLDMRLSFPLKIDCGDRSPVEFGDRH